MNEAVTYSLSISKNGEVINDNIIELNNNNIEFHIKFSVDKDKYIEDFDLYNLYVMVNFKEIDFFVDNNYCNNIYSFQLNEFERSKEMKIKASLDGIENPNNIIVSILPKECNENNFDHGMLILYDIKNDNQVIKRDYKYTDYKTSKSGYYFSGYNNASNPWYGNPYADLNTTYKGNDSSHTGLYGTQYVGTSVGNTTSLSSQGTVRLNANVFFSGLVTFKSTHFVKVDGTYQRQYLTTNP